MDSWLASIIRHQLSRRRFAVAALAALGLGAGLTRNPATAICQPAGAGCSVVGLCCTGSLCHVSAINPNMGICIASTDPAEVGLVVHQPGEPLPPPNTVMAALPTPSPRPTRIPRSARPTSTPGPTPAHQVRIKLECDVLPERIRLHNAGTSWVQVVRVLGGGGAVGVFEAQEMLRPGDRIEYLTGIASGETELNEPMFPLGPWEREGVVVEVLALDENGESPFEQPEMLAFRGYCSGRRSRDVTDTWIEP